MYGIEIDRVFSFPRGHDQHRKLQRVQHLTRHGTSTNGDNILDFVVLTDSSSLVKSSLVEESHHLSDHRLIFCDLRTGRVKQPPPTRLTRKLNKIDNTDFERRLRQSLLFTHAATAAVSFITQIEEAVSNLLDTVLPLRVVPSFNIAHLRRLSPQAVKVKQEGCRSVYWKESMSPQRAV